MTDVVTKPRAGIFRTALRLLPLQAAFRGGEALLPLLLAAWLGRTEETDLYYVLAAYFVFVGALLSAAFQDSAVVPILIEVRARDAAAEPTIAGALLGHTLLIGSALGVVLGGGAAIFALVTSSHAAVALELIALMAAGLVAIGVRSFYVGLLNARGVFHAHPVASGFGMIVTIPLIFAGRVALGVPIVPLAMLAGELVAIAILALGFARADGLRIRPTLARPEPVRRIFALVKLEAMGQIITRINPVIDQLMAALTAVVGGGTLLRYSNDVASLPTSILQATLLPVFLTHVAEQASEPSKFAATLRRTLLYVVALLAALAGVFAALRGPLCRVLFLHGAMDADGVAKIAEILPWALLGVPAFGALLILARAHVARQNSRIMPSMGVLNATLNIGFNAILVRPLGLSGLALSTSITYAVVAIVFWIRLPKAARSAS